MRLSELEMRCSENHMPPTKIKSANAMTSILIPHIPPMQDDGAAYNRDHPHIGSEHRPNPAYDARCDQDVEDEESGGHSFSLERAK
jgi:hypothetical protein